MAVIVQNKRTGGYLYSPWTWPKGSGHTEELWPWMEDRAQAHHFKDRTEAKEKIRTLYPEGKAPSNRELTFHKVG